MGRRALILAGGDPPDPDFLASQMRAADIIVAADSGANALSEGLEAIQLLIGDMDSIEPGKMAKARTMAERIKTVSSDKDETDTMLAIDAAIDMGAESVTILGALGKRPDHHQANIALLEYALEKGVEAELAESDLRVFLVTGEVRFPVCAGCIVSVFALTEKCIFRRSAGLKYPLDGLTLLRSKPIGVSNAALTNEAAIDVADGTALVMVFFGKKEGRS